MSTEPITSNENSENPMESANLDEENHDLPSHPPRDTSQSNLIDDSSTGQAEPLNRFATETLPHRLDAQESLKLQVLEVMKTKSDRDSMGLLPPEDRGEAHQQETQIDSESTHLDHLSESKEVEESELIANDEQINAIKDSTPPRVPSLGLDAVGDSQTPQPVSLTPLPKGYVESALDSSEVEGLNDADQFDHAVQLSSLAPADLDLIAHSPPTHVNLQEVTPAPGVSADSFKEGELFEDPSPLPRVITNLPHQKQLLDKSYRKLEAFLLSLEEARGSNVLIVIKGHPDPDCLGSASALQYCYREFDIKSSILYFDEISHPENRALVKVIEMEMTLYDESFEFDGYDYLAFVDSQDATINGQDMNLLPPLLTFIDHHKETGKVQAKFIDIREDLGATSSIFAEYLEYVPEFSLQKSLSTHAYIATALMHGIRTDTDDLMLATARDFHAAGYLRQFIDRDLLRMVSKQSVTARTMEIITKGLNNKIIKGTFLLAGVGFVREEDRDGIAQTADFLIRHEGVETAVVFGIVNDKYVDGSLRTSSATVDPDRWLKELFGNDESGRPFGGGRRNKGGFRVPLGLLGRSPNRKALWQLGEQTIHDIIFEKIGEKDSRDDDSKTVKT